MKIASTDSLGPDRRRSILSKVAESRQHDIPTLHKGDVSHLELKDQRTSLGQALGQALHQRFGNVQMGERGPSWQRELSTRVPGLSLTSERPVDLRLPATYGMQFGGEGGSAALQYTPGMGPRAAFDLPIGEGRLKSNLQSMSAPPGLLGYMLGANYSRPLNIAGIKNPELSINANVGGQLGSGASAAPDDYGLGVSFGGEW